jgi:hypothetical protein
LYYMLTRKRVERNISLFERLFTEPVPGHVRDLLISTGDVSNGFGGYLSDAKERPGMRIF